MKKFKWFAISIFFMLTISLALGFGVDFNQTQNSFSPKNVLNAGGDITVVFIINNQVAAELPGFSLGDTIDTLPQINEEDFTAPAGTDQNPPKWYFEDTEMDFSIPISEGMLDNNILYLRRVYVYNTYTITFILPDSVQYREVVHGQNVEDIPLPQVSFPNYVSYNSSLTNNVVRDATVIIEVKSYLMYIIIGSVIAFIIMAYLLVKFTVFGDKKRTEGEKVFDAMIARAKEQDARIYKLQENRMKIEEEAKLREELEKEQNTKRDDFDDFLKKI